MSRSEDTAALERLLALVHTFSGLDFPAGRRAGIERPIQAAMQRLEVASVAELVHHLSAPEHRHDLEDVVASLTIGETHFFRNHPQIDALRTVILPELIARRRQERTLRIWSAGCSSGEEAYSVAIALDMLLPSRAQWNITLRGTDINEQALVRARSASYSEWSFRGVPKDVRARYFEPEGRRFRLKSWIREMVEFEYLNLVEDSYPSAANDTSAMDLILCRNVLIYFRHETIEQVVARLEQSLAPDGWLIAGHAEAPMPIFRQLFDAHALPMAVIYRKRSPHGAVGELAPSPVSPWSPADVAGGDTAEFPVVTDASAAIASDASAEDDGLPRDCDVACDAQKRFDAGDRAGALRLLKRAADEHPSQSAPLVLAARMLAATLQYDDAELVVRLALERDQIDADAHFVHGLVLQGLNRADAALDALRRSAYLDPDHVLAHFSLACLLDTLGSPARACAALDRVDELLSMMDDDDRVVDEYECVTAGRLRELSEVRRQLLHREVSV